MAVPHQLSVEAPVPATKAGLEPSVTFRRGKFSSREDVAVQWWQKWWLIVVLPRSGESNDAAHSWLALQANECKLNKQKKSQGTQGRPENEWLIVVK